MKRNILRSCLVLAAFATGLTSYSAYAATAQATSTGGKFTPSFYVQGRYALVDSTRKTYLDFMTQTFRMGAMYQQARVTAVGQVEFRGNTYSEGPTSNSTSGGQGTAIRQAYVGYDLYKDAGTGTLTVNMGRFIPLNASQYGNDAITGMYNISGYSPEDGVMVQYAAMMGGLNLTAQFTLADNLPIYLYAPTGLRSNADSRVWTFGMGGDSAAFTSDYNNNGGGPFASNGSGTSGSSATSDKAYIGGIQGSTGAGAGKFEFALSYAHKGNNIVGTSGSGTSATAFERDTQYADISLGYNYRDAFKAGLWYSLTQLGQIGTYNDNNGAAAQFTRDASAPKDNYTVAGLGLQGDSSLHGLTDVWGRGGLLTYGAGVETFMHRQSDGSGATAGLSDSDASKNDVYLFTIGGGYKKNIFSTQLNYSYFISQNNVFSNQAQNHTTDSAHLVYLMTSVAL